MTKPETPELLPTISVDTALSQAASEAREKAESVPYSLRLHPELKNRAAFICARHGTDLSAYLRKCAELLVAGYSQDTTGQG